MVTSAAALVAGALVALMYGSRGIRGAEHRATSAASEGAGGIKDGQVIARVAFDHLEAPELAVPFQPAWCGVGPVTVEVVVKKGAGGEMEFALGKLEVKDEKDFAIKVPEATVTMEQFPLDVKADGKPMAGEQMPFRTETMRADEVDLGVELFLERRLKNGQFVDSRLILRPILDVRGDLSAVDHQLIYDGSGRLTGKKDVPRESFRGDVPKEEEEGSASIPQGWVDNIAPLDVNDPSVKGGAYEVVLGSQTYVITKGAAATQPATRSADAAGERQGRGGVQGGLFGE